MNKYEETKERLERLHGKLDDHGMVLALIDEIDMYREKVISERNMYHKAYKENHKLKKTLLNVVCNFYATSEV